MIRRPTSRPAEESSFQRPAECWRCLGEGKLAIDPGLRVSPGLLLIRGQRWRKGIGRQQRGRQLRLQLEVVQGRIAKSNDLADHQQSWRCQLWRAVQFGDRGSVGLLMN